MSTDIRHHLGACGEQFAADHLSHLGFTVLARNVRSRFGELDIVAADHSTLVFCEVKTRRVGPSVDPFEGLRREQRRRIRAMALAWLGDADRSVRRSTLRFDAIGVLVTGTGALVSLEHLEACF